MYWVSITKMRISPITDVALTCRLGGSRLEALHRERLGAGQRRRLRRARGGRRPAPWPRRGPAAVAGRAAPSSEVSVAPMGWFDHAAADRRRRRGRAVPARSCVARRGRVGLGDEAARWCRRSWPRRPRPTAAGAGSGPTTPTRSGCGVPCVEGGNDDGGRHDGQDEQRADPEDPAAHALADLAAPPRSRRRPPQGASGRVRRRGAVEPARAPPSRSAAPRERRDDDRNDER